MASVSSLDQDVRNMRLSKYTPKAANEVKDWIEEVLGEKLGSGDLLESLKDGVALCKLVNLAVPHPGVKYKNSRMPFVQMENISHFLRAVQLPPLSLQPHDVFLTVDLYESKDPAQVLQCLGGFSRVANAANPSQFKRAIGPKNRSSVLNPQDTGNSNSNRASTPTIPNVSRGRNLSNASQSTTHSSNFTPRATALSPTLTGGSNSSKATVSTNGGSIAGGPISSWSRKNDETSSAPAWNIHQYGYMGGASQGNQGIAFGARRQITSNSPVVPTLADKERKRRELEAIEAEDARLKDEAEEAAREARRVEEERERIAEEQRWAEETRKQREYERRLAEAEKQKWLEDEEKWKAEEAKRDAEKLSMNEKQLQRVGSDTLQGQYLSQYRADQGSSQSKPKELTRVQELELELEKARIREQEYEKERQSRLQSQKSREHMAVESHDLSMRKEAKKDRSRSRSRNRAVEHSQPHHDDEEWRASERDYIRQNWSKHHKEPFGTTSPTPSSPRPLPEPTPTATTPSTTSTRPLPDPVEYAASNRTDRFLSSNPAPTPSKPVSHFPSEIGGFDSEAERHAETQRREASQTKTKAGKWAASSLLEREMERERSRQQEWELGQRSTKEAAEKGVGKGLKEGTVGEGGSWDVNQYGYTGGDSQNRGGVSFGGRRQIIGPRPPPS